MKLFWGKFRLRVMIALSKALGVPIKIREEYLEEHVFGMKVSETATAWIDRQTQSVK